jgi:uncharacterized membrane protein
MTPSFIRRQTGTKRPLARKPKFFRLRMESLEDRLAPAVGLPPDLIVGRTQSAYSTADLANHSLSITYTVYNQRAEDISGVLLTTTLQSGVAFQSATSLPDRDGSQLAWSLGIIPAFGRTAVTITVVLPASPPLTIDSGAQASGTLNAGLVTSDTPAVTLTTRLLPNEFLASTPDANTTDPFVQEQAARLRYDPQAIFDYLNEEVGYESYRGSLRGARGTLWSEAGNALDEASLGVALFRASGIPARYAHGTLPDPLAKQLILSMFPAGFQTIGIVPAGTITADPANDPELLAETRDHYWLQYDTGSGFQNADTSGFTGSGLDTAFTIVSDTFAEVDDGLRHTVRISLEAETYNQASALFAFGNGLSTQTVLDHTFRSVDLVGRPLTVGHFVSVTQIPSLVFSAKTSVYSPYITEGDLAFPDLTNDHAIRGTDFQEVLTNFPFGSQVTTGLFLKMSVTGPGRQTEVFERALVDRIGFAARQGTASGTVSFDPNGPAAISPFDLTTINVIPGRQDARALTISNRTVEHYQAKIDELIANNANVAVTAETSGLVRSALTASNQLRIAHFLALSDSFTIPSANGLRVKAYFDSPRITIVKTVAREQGDELAFMQSIDLRKNDMRVLSGPGEVPAAAVSYEILRGMTDTNAETVVMDLPQTGTTNAQPLSAAAIIQLAKEQGIALAILAPGDSALLDTLAISAEAKARITLALADGKIILVPRQSVVVGSTQHIGWYESNPTTGETIGVMEDGGHQAIVEWVKGIWTGFLIGVKVSLIGETIAFFLEKNDVPKPVEWGGGASPAVLEMIHFMQNPANYRHPFAGVLLGFTIGLVLSLTIVSPFYQGILEHFFPDPPLPPARLNAGVLSTPRQNVATREQQTSATIVGGAVTGSLEVPNVSISGDLSATWNSNSTNSFLLQTLTSPAATVTDSNGTVVGTGTISLASALLKAAEISGSNQYQVTGHGQLAFYGSAADSLGVSGEWNNYSATVQGTVTLRIATDALVLNGVVVPAGTYTIAATASTFTGHGRTSSPSFADSASVAVTNGTVNLGPGTGSLTVGGISNPVNPGSTLAGFAGTLTVSDNGNVDSLSLTGTAAQLLRVDTPFSAVSTDQNTPVTIPTSIVASLTGVYDLIVEAPENWNVAIETNGQITVSPAPGLQSGTYSIRIVARSQTNGDLVAQTIVAVTLMPTLPGLDFAVAPDPIFTVPYNGAEIPSSFRANLRNLGPAAEVFQITSVNLPAGFALNTPDTSLRIPAGETGIVGLYLTPIAGQVLPAPGTVLTFDITAANSDSSIVQTRTVSFTMPETHGVVMTVSPRSAGTTPGVALAGTLTLSAVGNVPEVITLSSELSIGLSLTGLPTTITLQPGETVNLPFSLLPSAATPLNSTLNAKVIAKFNPAGELFNQQVQIPVRVVVPGADEIATAAAVAAELGDGDLSARLNDLGIALTELVQSPTNEIPRNQALAALDTVIDLIAANPYLTTLVPTLTNDRGILAQATTAPTVQDAVVQLGNTLGPLAETLTAQSAHRFTLAFVVNTAVAQPLSPNTFQILLRNTGTQTTTYDMTVLNLPNGVTAVFSQNSITLAPGQSTFTAGNPELTLTLTPTSTTELAPFGFEVKVAAHDAPVITRSVTGSLTVRSELVTVVSVSPTPAFTDPGVPVVVSARLLNAVNREQTATVRYTVINSDGTTVFTSTPVNAPLTVLTSLSTVALGTLDTTGFPLGNYTIVVTVFDDQGTPIPGASGSGQLLIGSPVTASLSVDPTSLPPGTSSVTNTMRIDVQGQAVGPLGVVSLTELPGAGGVVKFGHYVYASGTTGIRVYDIVDPSNPLLIHTFGTSPTTLEIRGDKLYALTFGGPFGRFSLMIYSLADPENPQFLGNAKHNNADGIPYSLAWNMVVTDTHVFVSLWSTTHLIGGLNDIKFQTGDLIAIDVSDPTSPVFVSALLNNYGTNNDGISQFLNVDVSGGDGNLWEIVQIDANTLLVAGSTASGDDTQTGSGVVHVIDISNPAQMAIVQTLVIPGTVQAVGLSIEGNSAFVTASQGGWSDPASPNEFIGNLVLATLDISDPRNPSLIHSEVLDRSSVGPYSLRTTPLGNGLFGFSSQGNSQEQPAIFVVDANNPTNLITSRTTIPAITANLDGAENFLYATSPSGLIIYQVDAVDTIPVTATVQVPTNTGVTVVPGSFNRAPTRTLTVAGGTTYEWDLSLSLATTITWQTTVTDLQPGRSRAVAINGSVSFTSQGTAGQAALAGQFVTGVQIIGLMPTSQTIAPGGATSFTVNLSNPTNAPITYSLAVFGVPPDWIDLIPTVTIPANSSTTVPLTVASDSFAALADYGLTVTATAGTVHASVQGTLTLAGSPVLPDPESHGIVVTLTPSTATAGQTTSAKYVVRLTNTGSAVETYTLTAALPASVAGTFSQSTVTVPPGAGNFRDVELMLTPQSGTAAGSVLFTVTTTSTTVEGSTNGTLVVVRQGVSVELDRTTANPGETLLVTVTNQGTIADTFDLSVAGPGGLAATLGSPRITLNPGQSTTVPVVTSQSIGFALPGALPLTVIAQSVGNPAVKESDTADIVIAQTIGLNAAFPRTSQVIPIPGTADFLLFVKNTGNGEDTYSATITTTTGPVTASLVGLDGNPTTSISSFRLTGLSQGMIVVRTGLPVAGIGTVTVRIQSLTNPSLVSTNVATLSTPQPAPILVGGSTNGGAIAYAPVNGQFGSGTVLAFFPGFTGDVRTATADVTGDGIPDYIGGSGPGMRAEVAIIDGATMQVVARFTPFESTYRLGIFVSAADITGDGRADVIATPDLGGGPVVALYDGAKLVQGLADGKAFGQPAQIVRFFGIEGDPNFRGGVRTALGDMNGDQTPDLLISAGFQGGPRIAMFDGNDLALGDSTPRRLLPDYFAFEPTLRNGAFVALGDITGDGKAELAFGGGPTGANRVRIFDTAQLLAAPPFNSLDNAPATAQLNNFFSGDPSLRGGVRLAIRPIDNSGKAALITASGNNEAARIQVYTATTLLSTSAPTAPDQTIDPFGTILTNGVFVG